MEKLPDPTLAKTQTKLDEIGCSQEDALAYLRCSTISVYKKGSQIFGPEQPSGCMYLVIDGRVSVTRVAPNGQEVLIDIYLPDEFFGEGAFVEERRSEKATAVENTQVMTWTAAEIEQTISREPRLGLALAQLMVQRSIEFQHRLESLSTDNVAQRLARTLLRFGDRLGREEPDGSILMPPFTHAVLGQYVGTSREIVTLFMMQFRKDGYLRYSRKGIVLHRGALKGWLQAKRSAAGG